MVRAVWHTQTLCLDKKKVIVWFVKRDLASSDSMVRLDCHTFHAFNSFLPTTDEREKRDTWHLEDRVWFVFVFFNPVPAQHIAFFMIGRSGIFPREHSVWKYRVLCCVVSCDHWTKHDPWSATFGERLTISTPREISLSIVSLSDLSTDELTDERSDSGCTDPGSAVYERELVSGLY